MEVLLGPYSFIEQPLSPLQPIKNVATDMRRIGAPKRCGTKPTNSRPPAARLRGVGQVSDLPVAASLRARLTGTQLSPVVSGEPEVPGTGGSETHPTFGNPFVGRL